MSLSIFPTQMAIHWKVPTIISSSLLAGVLLAIGHHAFYASLDGKLVDDAKFSGFPWKHNLQQHVNSFLKNDMDRSVEVATFGQSINIGIGTAFAFLVKTALALTVVHVYWQGFWGMLSRKKMRISTIDSLAAQLSALYEIANFRTLQAEPLLVGLALVAWLLPIASVVTPGTLTVRTIPLYTNNETLLPAIDFAGGKLASWTFNNKVSSEGVHILGPDGSTPVLTSSNNYTGPSQRLSRMGFATAIQAAIPLVPMPAENSSYTIEFAGPIVQCKERSDSILAGFNRPMGCVLVGTNQSCPIGRYRYLSWVPDSWTARFLGPLRSLNGSSACNSKTDDGEFCAADYVALDTGEPVHLTDSNANNGPALRVNNVYGPGGSYIGWGGNEKNGRRLVVAAYTTVPHLNGTHLSRSQEVDRQVTPAPPSNWKVVECVLRNATYGVSFSSSGQDQKVTVSTRARELIQALDGTGDLPAADGRRPLPSESELKTWSYEALMEVLAKLLVGSVQNSAQPADAQGGASRGVTKQAATSIFQTDLAFTPELKDIYGRLEGANASIDDPYEGAIRPTLSDAIETLFTNMTLALFSQPVFLTSEPTLPTNITSISMHNVYHYDWRNLVLAYGIQNGVAFLIAIMGWVFIIRNGVSYSNDFSTVIRTTRNARLSTGLSAADTIGCDPLPKHIKRATLQVGGRATSDALGESTDYDPGKLHAGVDERTTMIPVHHGSTHSD